MAGLALVTESFSFEDGQPVQLEDGSMAYIHHTPKGGPMVIVAGGEEEADWQGLGVSTSTVFPETAMLTKSSLGQTTEAAATRQQQVLNISMGLAAGFGTRPATKT